MKVKDFKVKLTDNEGNSIIIGLDDIYAYEDVMSRDGGIIIKSEVMKNSNFSTDIISHNSGYDFRGIPKEVQNFDIEVVE